MNATRPARRGAAFSVLTRPRERPPVIFDTGTVADRQIIESSTVTRQRNKSTAGRYVYWRILAAVAACFYWQIPVAGAMMHCRTIRAPPKMTWNAYYRDQMNRLVGIRQIRIRRCQFRDTQNIFSFRCTLSSIAFCSNLSIKKIKLRISLSNKNKKLLKF